MFQVSLSPRQDDFIILHVSNSFDSLLQVIVLQFLPFFLTMSAVSDINQKVTFSTAH